MVDLITLHFYIQFLISFSLFTCASATSSCFFSLSTKPWCFADAALNTQSLLVLRSIIGNLCGFLHSRGKKNRQTGSTHWLQQDQAENVLLYLVIAYLRFVRRIVPGTYSHM